MKWYKKQLDQIKKSEDKKNKSAGEKPASAISFNFHKTRAGYQNFHDPVAASKRTRKKTDLP